MEENVATLSSEGKHMSLSDDDKNWIASVIASAIGASEARLTAKLESLPAQEDLERFATPQDLERFATREDLERFATREDLEPFATRQDLERFATREDLEPFATRQDLERFATRQDLERVETSLLTEFHKWASPMEQRMRTHREALRALDLETARLDERITKLEPPPQQH
jgi:hypothetical protein